MIHGPHIDYHPLPIGPSLPPGLQDKEMDVLLALRSAGNPDVTASMMMELAIEEDQFYPLGFFINSQALQMIGPSLYEGTLSHLRYTLDDVLISLHDLISRWHARAAKISFKNASRKTQQYLSGIGNRFNHYVMERYGQFEAEQRQVLKATLTGTPIQIFPQSNQKTFLSLIHFLDLWEPMTHAWGTRNTREQDRKAAQAFFENEADLRLVLLMQGVCHDHSDANKKRIVRYVQQSIRPVGQVKQENQFVVQHTSIAMHMMSAYLEPGNRRLHWSAALSELKRLTIPREAYISLQGDLTNALRDAPQEKDEKEAVAAVMIGPVGLDAPNSSAIAHPST